MKATALLQIEYTNSMAVFFTAVKNVLHCSGNLKETNSLTRKNIKDLQKATQENTEKLEAEGFSVCRITECEWQQMKKSPEISSFLKTLKCVEPRKQLIFEKILKQQPKKIKNCNQLSFKTYQNCTVLAKKIAPLDKVP